MTSPGRAAALALALVAGGSLARAAGGKPTPSTIISEAELKERLKKHRGRVVVLHFWATWCVPCLHEVPLVSTLARESKARGIDLVSISLDDPTERAAEYVGRVLVERGGESMTNTILRIENADAFVASIDPRWEGSIPAFFAYDRQGNLRRAFVGEMTREEFGKLVADLARPPPVKK